MKRLLIPLLAALALPTAVNAGVDPAVHNLCKDVSDYMGCVKANSKKDSINIFNKIKNSFQNKNEFSKLIERRCTNPHIDNEHPQTKACKDYLKEIGEEKAAAITSWQHDRCIGKYYKFKNTNDYERCVDDVAKDPLYTIDGKLKQQPRTKEVFYHKGESYTASKTCSDGKRFYWNVEKGFLKKEKVVEIGCLSDYELQSLKNQSRAGSGGAGRAASDRINNQTQQTINNMNQNYRNDFKNWQMKEFGY